MKRKSTIFAAAIVGLLLSMPALAQQYYAPAPNPYRSGPGNQYGQNDPFYQFAARYPGTAQQLRNDPSLLSNQYYMRQHPEVFDFLKANPGYAQELHRNPNMLRQGRYSQKDWDDFYKHNKHQQYQKYKKPKKHKKGDWTYDHHDNGHDNGHDRDHGHDHDHGHDRDHGHDHDHDHVPG